MTDIVKLYNPSNAASLTPEELLGLQNLDSAQLKELANAYPNSSMQRAFLLTIDKNKPAEKQLPALSTYQNLWNLREKNGQRQYVAFAFKGNYKPVNTPQRAKKTEVLDLSETELLSLPGFKKQDSAVSQFAKDMMKELAPLPESLKQEMRNIKEPETVKVTKIKKTPIKKTKK